MDISKDIKILHDYCARRKDCIRCHMYKNCWSYPYDYKSRDTGEIETAIRNIRKMCNKNEGCDECKYGDITDYSCALVSDPKDWDFSDN